jgi:serine/threonine protein kinase
MGSSTSCSHSRQRADGVVLEDPGGEPLSGLLKGPLDLTLFLRIAVGLTAALVGLHGRCLIHKDIKPANVMVDPMIHRVWLTGFGIASALPRERQAPEPPETIAGTLAYIAPEQTGRMNRTIDSRSDLYSLGVTLYEMLQARRPWRPPTPLSGSTATLHENRRPRRIGGKTFREPCRPLSCSFSPRPPRNGTRQPRAWRPILGDACKVGNPSDTLTRFLSAHTTHRIASSFPKNSTGVTGRVKRCWKPLIESWQAACRSWCWSRATPASANHR